jgi:hypothetical protein
MSRIILEKTIRAELEKLNDAIDIKILKGLPYKREALRHRFLLYRLSDLHRLPRFNSSWLQRSINTIATFVL